MRVVVRVKPPNYESKTMLTQLGRVKVHGR